jgi:hypothetical protein
MFTPFLPKQVDNNYRGTRLAIWLLAAILLVRLGISGATLFNTHDALQTADSIPVDSFGPAGAAAAMSLFKLLGLELLVLNLLGVGVLIRYRTLIPFTYFLLLVEQVSRRELLILYPIVRTGEHMLPFNINLALIGVLCVGFVLSLFRRRERNNAS